MRAQPARHAPRSCNRRLMCVNGSIAAFSKVVVKGAHNHARTTFAPDPSLRRRIERHRVRRCAERYRDNPDAIRMLEQKLRAGGRAHWGDMPMPVSAERGGPPLSAEDAHTLIEWVMSQ
jgi:hypothetical protein